MATEEKPTSNTPEGAPRPDPARPAGRPSRPAPVSNTGPGNANTTRIVLGLVIVALVAVAGYFAFRTSELSRENTEFAENKAELETEINQLNERITSMGAEIENRDIQLDEKNRRLEEVTSELTAARNRIEQLRKSGALAGRQLEEFKYKVDQMQYYIEKYQTEIAELQKENQRLTGEVTNLNQTVRQRDSTLTEREKENTLLATKVQAASILKATGWQFYEINRRGRESESRNREMRLRDDESLRFCFTVNENVVAEIGARSIYATIKGPDGSIYKALDGGSGYFTANGQEVPYSAKKDITYDRTAQRVCVDYKPQGEFQRGQHQVTVYADGFEIGKNTFLVK